MSSGDAESWARLRLVQGESSAQVWELVASAGQTTLTVGSNPSCNWVVREEGVAPVHFSLHWDGATLRVADTFGAGNVRVDGVPVAQQWRPLAGRVRLDFGKAAIVIEASATGVTSRSDAPHPLDPGSVPPGAGSSAPPGARPNLKATLIGVSPLTGSGAPPIQAAQVTPAPPSPSEAPGPSESFRPRRPSDSQRTAKPTLVGIAMPTGAPAGGASASQPPAATASQPVKTPAGSTPAAGPTGAPTGAPTGPQTGRTGVAQGTLMGIGLAEAVAQATAQAQQAQRVGGASLADGDQRTIQGFPSGGSSAPPPASHAAGGGRRVTQAGMVSEAPGVTPGAVAQAPVRTVSSPPAGASPSSTPPPDPMGSRWQEVPGRSYSGEIVDLPPEGARDVPKAVLVTPAESAPRSYPPSAQAGQGAPRSRADRFSDAPTQMRDPGQVESRRPANKGTPWAYVGIGLLTALAYFAWLYLLDHL